MVIDKTSKISRLRIIGGLLVLGLTLFSINILLANIVDSVHDLSDQGWQGGEICKTCHTPHNSDPSVIAAPLWNHTLTTSTFILYSSNTLDATMTQPSAISKLCLGCHDGTVALDSFGGVVGEDYISGGRRIGTDLTEQHPVAFAFNAALAALDGSLFNPEITPSGINGGTITEDMLFNGMVECATCHDVHDRFSYDKILVKANQFDLCITCHNL